MTTSRTWTAMAVLGGLFIAGCVPTQPVTPEQMSSLWVIGDDPWPHAQPRPLTLGGRQLPNVWIIRHEADLMTSTISIVRGVDSLSEATTGERFEIAFSREYTDRLADKLSRWRQSAEGFRDAVETARQQRPAELAPALATALWAAEEVVRLSAAPADTGAGSPEAWAAEPLVRMLSAVLGAESKAAAASYFARPEPKQLRAVLARMLLKLGFGVAGRELSESVVREAVSILESAPDERSGEQRLEALLDDALRQAPPHPTSGDMSRVALAVIRYGPSAMRMFESFLRQWEHLDRIEVEVRDLNGDSVVGVSVHVKPGREIRLRPVFTMQPGLAFRGGVRITPLPEAAGCVGQTCVLLEPITDDGGVYLSFGGFVWSLVRLLAVPVDDAMLREIRVIDTGTDVTGEGIAVALYMQAADADPRRVMAFHDVRQVRLVRRPFEITTRQQSRSTLFTYITPGRMFYYQRDE